MQRKRVGAKSKGTLDYLHSVKSFSLVTVARAGVKPSLLHSVITDSWCKTTFHYFWHSVATEFPLGNCYCFWYRTITAFSYYCWCERLFSEFSSSWVINQLLFDNSWWSQLETFWSLIFAKNEHSLTDCDFLPFLWDNKKKRSKFKMQNHKFLPSLWVLICASTSTLTATSPFFFWGS